MKPMEWTRGDKIGHGSFGSVHLAIPTNQILPLMAVKSASVFNSESLNNERRVLNSLCDNPHVIRCFGCNQSCENGEKFCNLLLEYASRGSLADRVKNSGNGLPELDVRRCTKSILKGVKYVHDNGFVHCDIKIQNILICSENGNDVVKIADFGLAKRENFRGRTEVRGTPMNMSPESVTVGEYESPADIWAVGCAVVEMLTGKPAWRCKPDSDFSSLFLRIGIGEEIPEIPKKLSEQGKDFLIKCFVKDPRQRWTAEMLLNHPFVADCDSHDHDHDDSVPLKGQYEEASISPRCPFDFLESPELPESLELSSWCGSSSSQMNCDSSPENILRQLVTDQRPDWSVIENWVTVR